MARPGIWSHVYVIFAGILHFREWVDVANKTAYLSDDHLASAFQHSLPSRWPSWTDSSNEVELSCSKSVECSLHTPASRPECGCTRKISGHCLLPGIICASGCFIELDLYGSCSCCHLAIDSIIFTLLGWICWIILILVWCTCSAATARINPIYTIKSQHVRFSFKESAVKHEQIYQGNLIH